MLFSDFQNVQNTLESSRLSDSLDLTDCSQVDMLGSRYKSVNFGAGKDPGLLSYGGRSSLSARARCHCANLLDSGVAHVPIGEGFGFWVLGL